MDALENNLPLVNIANCYIFIFNNKEQQINPFDDCLLAFAFTNGVRRETATIPAAAAKELLGKILFTENRAYTMLAQLLHVGDEFIGFAVYEPGPMDERVYQTLNLNISTALNSAIYIEKLDSNYRFLVEESHQEGMAEIITGILHNVSNILNSIFVSLHVINDLIHTAPFEDFNKANKLLQEHIADIEHFINADPKGIKLMEFYTKLEIPFRELLIRLADNITLLKNNVDLINDIVIAQRSYTEIKSIQEELDLLPIVEDALKMNAASLEKNHIRIIKDYRTAVKALVQKTKLFHILVNLINNAKDAMLEVPEAQRHLVL
jgi:signal transduction histidine kinase